jgi:hypothetical protein
MKINNVRRRQENKTCKKITTADCSLFVLYTKHVLYKFELNYKIKQFQCAIWITDPQGTGPEYLKMRNLSI